MKSLLTKQHLHEEECEVHNYIDLDTDKVKTRGINTQLVVHE